MKFNIFTINASVDFFQFNRCKSFVTGNIERQYGSATEYKS